MKKEDAVSRLDRAGETINDLSASAWNTALNPTRYGWVPSILSIASIPVLSAASIGHLVTSAVVNQVDPGTFERITTLGRPDDRQP
jgi:pyridoxal biosynthesis lyase PdxS